MLQTKSIISLNQSYTTLKKQKKKKPNNFLNLKDFGSWKQKFSNFITDSTVLLKAHNPLHFSDNSDKVPQKKEDSCK